jgi:hypothetical protein
MSVIFGIFLYLAIFVVVFIRQLAKEETLRHKVQRATPNPLEKLPAEVRIEIFKHYFATFRPERIYRECHYKESDTLTLLIALRDNPF